MKRIVMMGSVLGLFIATFACQPRLFNPNSPGLPMPTPTVTSTPVCGFTQVAYGGLQPTFILTPGTLVRLTPTSTTTPGTGNTWNPSLPPVNTSTPVITYPNVPFGGIVIRNLSDWQISFGTQPVPAGVDFNSQMLLVTIQQIGGCPPSGGFTITDVCEDGEKVGVTATEPLPPPLPYTGPCSNIAGMLVRVLAVRQSNLPVVVVKLTLE